jgi:uncharacterized protein YbjT (DUF2867 family)
MNHCVSAMERPKHVRFAGAMTTATILVLGATGKTGRRVGTRLTAAGHAVRVGSRFADPRFDWEEPATWAPAVAGVRSIYLTYQPDLAFPGAADRVAGVVSAADAAGVQRIVLLSGRNEPGARAAELIVEQSGLEWTVLTASFFAQNFSELPLALDGVLDGVLAFPAGDVLEPFVDVDDIADVAVEALTTDRHLGRRYELTGPRLMTFADAVAEIASATGRTIEYAPITIDAMSAAMRAEGVPDCDVEAYAELFATVLDGRNAYLSDDVERILGRPPRDFDEYIASTLPTGVWDVVTEWAV